MKTERGFTVPEVMVAAVMLLLAAVAGLSLVAQGRRSYRDVEARARLDEAARAALDVLAYEVRMAGYLGSLPPGSAVAGSQVIGTPEPAGLAVGGGCRASLALDLAVPLAGADGIYGASQAEALGCRPAPGGRAVPEADTLVVRHAAAETGRAVAGRLQLETTRRAGRLLTDGRGALGALATVHDLEVHAFYVSEDSTGAPGRPSLRRKRLVGGTAPAFQDEEIQAGVADLQVEAQVEVAAGGGTPELVFRPLGDVARDTPIRALRLWVLVAGEPGDAAVQRLPPLAYANRSVPGTTARFPRLLASRVVAVRNRGARP